MKIRGLFFFLILIQSTFATTELDKFLSKANELQLHKKRQWLSLGHYSKKFLGGHESRADGKNFFFATDGKTNPKNELIETLKAFYTAEKFKSINEHPICRFPARYKFLQSKLGLQKKLPCSDFKRFKNKLQAKSISLVFSSYFLDTPASAFGHTLIRLGKEKGNKFELLDYATNYAANATTGNAFLYGAMGMMGGFRGEFAAMPYFYKVREYNDFESRDLWDYELNLTQSEVDMVVSHIWEMKQTHFDYYYFDENCSFFMLALLDTANENWRLAEQTSTFVIPVDTIKIVTETPGLLRKVSYRPSKMRITKKNISKLNDLEFESFNKVFEAKNPLLLASNFTKNEQAKVLDSVLDYLDFKHASEILKEEPHAMKWKRNMLIARSKTGIQSEPSIFSIPEKEQPHEGHGSRRVGLGMGSSSNKGSYTQLEYRFALHDFLDPGVGQNPNATMEMGNLKLRYNIEEEDKNNTSHLRLEEFALVRVESLSPLERLFSKLSWRFFLGARTIKDRTCDYCVAPSLQVGTGYAKRVNKFDAYLFLTGEADLHKELSHEGARLAAGPEAAIYYHYSSDLNMKLYGEYRFQAFPNIKHHTNILLKSDINL